MKDERPTNQICAQHDLFIELINQLKLSYKLLSYSQVTIYKISSIFYKILPRSNYLNNPVIFPDIFPKF